MSKIVNQEISFKSNSCPPKTFCYRNQTYAVGKIIANWREAGQWWLGESELYAYLVQAGNAIFELHFLAKSNRWILYRIFD